MFDKPTVGVLRRRDLRKSADIEKTDIRQLQAVRPKACRLPFRLKGLRTFACFPILEHTAFYFPPAARKDRAVNSMEIKDFIILWTYSQ